MDEPNQEVQEDGSAPPSKKSRKKPAVEKWGSKVIDSGFSMIPSLLLRAQHRLKLSPTQLAVLVQIIDHWWEASRKPYPSKKELAKRLGSVAKIVKLEHAWRRLDGRNDDGFQVAPFPG